MWVSNWTGSPSSGKLTVKSSYSSANLMDIGTAERVADRAHVHRALERGIQLLLGPVAVGEGDLHAHARYSIAAGLVTDQVQLGRCIDRARIDLLLLQGCGQSHRQAAGLCSQKELLGVRFGIPFESTVVGERRDQRPTPHLEGPAPLPCGPGPRHGRLAPQCC